MWISLLKFFIGKEYGQGGDDGGGGGYNVAGLTSGGYSGEAPSNYMAAGGGQSSVECNKTYFQIWQGTHSKFFKFMQIWMHCEVSAILVCCNLSCNFQNDAKEQRCSKLRQYFLA